MNQSTTARRVFLITPIVFLLGILASCSKEEPASAAPGTKPVKTMQVTGGDKAAVRQFPARVEAIKTADLAFQVPGQVVEIPIKEGQPIAQNAVVAKLDATDYEIVLRDKKVNLETAKKNLERGEKLLPDGFISQKDYDQLKSRYTSARADLEAAQQNVDYTVLRAPFNGEVARKLIENYEQVQAKQVVFTVTDRSKLEIKVNLPERLVQQIRPKGEGASARTQPRVTAVFDTKPENQYPVKFDSSSAKADENTQTFEVTFIMDAPRDINLLPGMSATLYADLTGVLIPGGSIFNVPVQAVISDNQLDGTVWVVAEDMTVHPKPVTVGQMFQGMIEVTSGLEPGDRIVTAGVPFLVEGMKVTLLPDDEQPQ